MARLPRVDGEWISRFPHARGDGPSILEKLPHPGKISPRAWGWPGIHSMRHPLEDDFPTRVGMARNHCIMKRHGIRFPHARGDGPTYGGRSGLFWAISPRAWGWPAFRASSNQPMTDFPTRVGMARHRAARGGDEVRFPHARGDGPNRRRAAAAGSAISPRAWGWPALSGMPFR